MFVAEDDDFEEQCSRIRPYTIRPDRSVRSVIRIELPSEDQTVGATPYIPTTKARPSSSTAQGATEETQVALDISASVSSQADVSPTSVVIEVETTTQLTTQATNEDDEIHIVRET